MANAEQLIWKTQTSPQHSPITRQIQHSLLPSLACAEPPNIAFQNYVVKLRILVGVGGARALVGVCGVKAHATLSSFPVSLDILCLHYSVTVPPSAGYPQDH
eukprot:4360986-Amphidinium_carterae.1